jgi:hypothetical protein
MARPLRIELAGGVYHVTSRGDRREAIYRDHQDRGNWLAVLGAVCVRFIERFAQQGRAVDRLREVPRVQRRHLARPLSYYAGIFPDRREAMARAFLSGVYTMREIAEHFGVHYSTVSRAVGSLEVSVHDRSLCMHHRSLHDKGPARL